MRILGVDFLRASPRGLARRAARYDYVLLYGDRGILMDRLEAYRFLGVDARLLHTPVIDAPSLGEVLAALRLVEELSSRGRLLVEGHGVEGFLAASLLVSMGLPASSAIRRVGEAGYTVVYTPMHARLLALLEYLAGSGCLDELLAPGVEGLVELDLAVEHAYLLGGFLPVSPCRVCRSIAGRGGTVGEGERLAVEAARLLAPRVKNIVFEPGYDGLMVRLGCGTPGCGVDEGVERLYSRLARWLGLRGVRVAWEQPFEVACRVYGYLDPEVCRLEGRDG